MGTIKITPLGKLTFKTVVEGHTFIASEPEKIGGPDAGPTPAQFFIASIGTCTAMYADLFCSYNKFPIDGFEMQLDYTQDPKTTQVLSLTVKIKYPKAIQQIQKQMFEKFLEKCAVKKAITDGFPIAVDFSDSD